MASPAIEVGYGKVVSASANVCARAGGMLGIFVSNAASTPTITLYDDASTGTSTPLVTAFTPVSGTFYRIPANFKNGLYVVIGGTVSATVFLL